MLLSRRWVVAVLPVVGLLAFLAWPTRRGQPTEDQTPAEREPEGRSTPGVLVAMHMGDAIPPERCLVWTAAFQAAWDQLATDLGMEEGITLGAPARPEDFAGLNKGRLQPGVIPEGELTLVAGPATEATWKSIDAASDRGRPANAPPPSEEDIVVFARLQARLRYAVPFHVEPKPLLFGPKAVPVRAYGLESDAGGPMAERMREQVDVHLPDERANAAKQGVVVLHGVNGSRLVVSGRPPRGTLRKTWADLDALINTTEPLQLRRIDSLSIPRVAIRASRSYDELCKAPIAGATPGTHIAMALQHVSLTADERGAEVDAEAVLMAVGAVPMHVTLDGPFTLAMLAPGSDRPYAMAWIGSADALSPWASRSDDR